MNYIWAEAEQKNENKKMEKKIKNK